MLITKTTNMTFALLTPSSSNKLGFTLCQVFSLGVDIACARSQDTGQGAAGARLGPWESTVFISTEEKERSCSWSIWSRCHFVIHTKALCAQVA